MRLTPLEGARLTRVASVRPLAFPRVRDYAAFLRGINVGGHRVKGPELCAVFEDLGCTDVSTFRASGNVVFDADRAPVIELTARIEQGLEEALGYEAITFLRSANEVRVIAREQPFEPALRERSKGKLQVSMLSAAPPAKARKEVLVLATGEDLLAFGERELYWLPSGGILDSELDLKAIDRTLGQCTRRTMGTVQQIAAKHFSD